MRLKEASGEGVEEYRRQRADGRGQFCTNPSVVILLAGETTEQFISAVKEKFEARALAPLLSGRCARRSSGVKTLTKAGAKIITGGNMAAGPGYRFANTLLRVDGETFLAHAGGIADGGVRQCVLMVVVQDAAQGAAILKHLEGNLTGCVYSDTSGSDENSIRMLVPLCARAWGVCLTTRCPQAWRCRRR